MIDWSGWLTILDLFMLIGGSFGIFLAFRSSMASAERAIQERVITALKEEREIQDRKIEDMKREQERQNGIISTIRFALKQHGLTITIQDDFVTLSESNGKLSKVVRIQDRSDDDVS